MIHSLVHSNLFKVTLAVSSAMGLYLLYPRGSQYWLAIELGGTSTNLAIFLRNEKEFIVVKRKNVSSLEGPEFLLEQIRQFVKGFRIIKIGIASFGPVDVDSSSETYGQLLVLPGPKKLWEKFNLKYNLNYISSDCRVDTDVNCPALAEFVLGGHKTKNSLVYITVGTGVGIGIISNSKIVKGFSHPEGGHILVKPHESDQSFVGSCIYHKNCVEGFCTNHSISKRLNCKITELNQLADQHSVWDVVSYYIATLCLNIFYIANPQVIILGGGVMNRKCLYPKIREQFKDLAEGYGWHKRLDDMDNFIKEPTLSENSALLGACLIHGS